MIFQPSDYVTTKQLAKEFPAFPYNTLKQIAWRGNCPAVIRLKLNPNNKRAKILWIKPLFELWMLQNNSVLGAEIKNKRNAIRIFLEELVKKERGRPRSLDI